MFSRCSFSKNSDKLITSLFFIDFFLVNVFDFDVGEAWEYIQCVFIPLCIGVLLQKKVVPKGSPEPQRLLEGPMSSYLLRVEG